MISTEYKYEFVNGKSHIAIISLSTSVLGGNVALDFTNIIDELTNSGASCIVINAGAVEIMNSTGIGMLANAHSNLSKKGYAMMLVNIPDKIMKLFKMTHLDRVFKIYDNLDSAISACNS